MSRYLLGDVEQLSNDCSADCEYVCVRMLRLCLIVFASSLALCTCERGSCPPTLSVDICDATCGLSHPCNTTQICCPTACGGSMCVDPMTERHFVTLEKPGDCPEYPRGRWICSHTCTGDSDCPRTLKCCPNRCGALTCQRPESLPLPS